MDRGGPGPGDRYDGGTQGGQRRVRDRGRRLDIPVRDAGPDDGPVIPDPDAVTLFGSLTASTDGTLYGGAVNFHLLHHQLLGCYFAIRDGYLPVEHHFARLPGARLGGVGRLLRRLRRGRNAFPTSPATATLIHISADGTSSTSWARWVQHTANYNSGNLAFGPDGKLYFNCWNSNTNQVPTLFLVNTATGAVTQIGSTWARPIPWRWVPSGAPSTVSTPSPSPTRASIPSTRRPGVATGIGTVSGLPVGYTLDTIAFSSIPEPVRVNPPRFRHPGRPGRLSTPTIFVTPSRQSAFLPARSASGSGGNHVEKTRESSGPRRSPSGDDWREDIRHAGWVLDALLPHPGISPFHLGSPLIFPKDLAQASA